MRRIAQAGDEPLQNRVAIRLRAMVGVNREYFHWEGLRGQAHLPWTTGCGRLDAFPAEAQPSTLRTLRRNGLARRKPAATQGGLVSLDAQSTGGNRLLRSKGVRFSAKILVNPITCSGRAAVRPCRLSKARIERSSHKAAFGRTQRSGQSAIDNRSQIRASGHKRTPKRLVSTRILLSSFG